MGTARQVGIVSPAYNIYTPNERLDPEFVDLLVRMPSFAKEVTRFSKGIRESRLRLYPEGFFEVQFAVPPLAEQHFIVSRVRDKAAQIESLAAKTQRSIDLLKERRSALITAAVTGQIDLREAA
ncbi:type I restriction-modification system specificity determinant [mine drainage metagenome]|uniref:Type I restriction-modification system specificity determinant n=3 Tax=mine drainage metagenome TaxID=410659 RepID=T1AYR2_9ZZZZ